jgi:hypothetical protein
MTLLHLVRHLCCSPVGRVTVKPLLFWTAAKGQYIEETGLAGFILWQAGGDHNDILLDAIKSAVDGS